MGRTAGRRAGARIGDSGERGPDGEDVSGMGDDFAEDAAEGAFEGAGNLAGLDKHDFVALGDRVALGDFPLGDGALFHGQPPLRHGESVNPIGHYFAPATSGCMTRCTAATICSGPGM